VTNRASDQNKKDHVVMPRGLVIFIMIALVVLGLAVAGYAFSIRDHISTSETVVTTQAGHSKVTVTTKTPPSDTLLASLIGAATLLVLAGAFYPRIRNLPIPGTNSSVQVAPVDLTNDAITAAADAVDRELNRTQRDLSTSQVVAATLIAARIGSVVVGTSAKIVTGAQRVDVPPPQHLAQGQEAWDQIAGLALAQLDSPPPPAPPPG
jgi:hypothetical protein